MEVPGQIPAKTFFCLPSAIFTPARYEDIEGETAPVRRATLKVLSIVATSVKSRGRVAVEGAAFTGTGRLASLDRPIRSAVTYILAYRRLEDSPLEIDECLSNLAMAFDLDDTEALITAYAGHLVEDVCNVRTIVRDDTFEVILSIAVGTVDCMARVLKRYVLS